MQVPSLESRSLGLTTDTRASDKPEGQQDFSRRRAREAKSRMPETGKFGA